MEERSSRNVDAGFFFAWTSVSRSCGLCGGTTSQDFAAHNTSSQRHICSSSQANNTGKKKKVKKQAGGESRCGDS